MRCACRLDVCKTREAPDPVIDVNDEIAGSEARHLRDEILGALRSPSRPHQSVTEDVLLGNDRQIPGLKAGFESPSTARATSELAAPAPPPTRDRQKVVEAVIGEDVAQALARALAPERNDDALARDLACLNMRAHGIEDVAFLLGAFGSEVASRAGAGVNQIGSPLRRSERREHATARQPSTALATQFLRDRAARAATDGRARRPRPGPRGLCAPDNSRRSG